MSIKRIKHIQLGKHHKPSNLVWSDNKTISKQWKKQNGQEKILCGLYTIDRNKSAIHVSTDDATYKPESILMHELIHCMDERAGMPKEGSTEPLVEERGRLLLEFIMENKSLIKALWKL